MPVKSHSVMGSHFRRYRCLFLWNFLITSCCFSGFSFATDRITRGNSIRDGDTIVSPGQKFALGFFSPPDSGFRYVGIWYNKLTTESVVWVANRERPISGTDGILTIGQDGNLMVTDGNGDEVWSSKVRVASSNSTAVLMDGGNLVLQESASSGAVLWQSFDHPTDTYLPDMKVYMNVNGGETRAFTSWKSSVDPSPGNYSMGLDSLGSPQIVIWEGQNRRWRSGHWNGLVFTGIQDMRAVFLHGFKLLPERDGRMYFIYTPSSSSDIVRFLVDWGGIGRQERWIDESKEWRALNWHPANQCDMYNLCGPFGKCNQNDTPRCSCMKGFVPKDGDRWSKGDWLDGCIRREELQCQKQDNLSAQGGEMDGFLKFRHVKLPDFVDYVGSEHIEDCEKKCLQNCSCTAYAYVSGINCMIWTRDLVDVQQFEEGGNSLHIRLAHSEFGSKNLVNKTVVITTVVIGTLLVFVSIGLLLKHIMGRRGMSSSNQILQIDSSVEISTDLLRPRDQLGTEGQEATGTELAVFDFNSVAAATDNFSSKNKLGQGGFGPVYKGTLPGGQEIAVKRLARKSSQGLEEFKNEVTLIAKLQHRNLVRILGCCIQGEERMLIYEYMPNKSLDSYLFDSDRRVQLNWSKRFIIIEGIARGLIYLHRDSRLRIIHRDLKASNILLDEEMNPKISDFGMAKIYKGNQNEVNTNRVVGTYGYMAPEYAMEGLFSLKSDVYSFGVLLLEIITGRRNASFRSAEHSNIIGYAWDLWEEGRAIEMADPSILESCSREQVARCVHVSMLCVQDSAAHRPNMPAVVLMLESKDAALPMPRQPTFTSMRHDTEEDMWNENQDVVCSNNVTVSVIVGR